MLFVVDRKNVVQKQKRKKKIGEKDERLSVKQCKNLAFTNSCQNWKSKQQPARNMLKENVKSSWKEKTVLIPKNSSRNM